MSAQSRRKALTSSQAPSPKSLAATQVLPASPRLEHLKRQAKRLLKAYRSGDTRVAHRLAQYLSLSQGSPPLKLSDAQLVIAREYGFASWPRLKQHVQSLRQPADDVVEQFKVAVREGTADGLRRLLQQHPELKSIVDDPLFDFEAPAIVYRKTNRDMVEVLLNSGANINARSRWWAGSFGVLDDVSPEHGQFLIERGAGIDIHAASGLGLIDRLQELLTGQPDLVNAPGGDGMRPLHFARSPAVIDLLLDHGAEIDARDVDHNGTPAQHAIKQPEKLRHLLRRGARPDIFMACVEGDIAMAQRVLQADPSALASRIGQGEYAAPGGHIYIYVLSYTARPLDLAAQHGHSALVEFLLPHSSPQQRFLFACLRGDAEQAQTELAQHPDLMQTLEPDDRSVICDAAWRNDAAAVAVMLQAGFDVNTRDVHASTPIDRAALRGYRKVVELCLAHGADLDVVNSFGGTPLEACLHGSTEFRNQDSEHAACVELMLQAGATPPAQPWGSAECIAVLQRHAMTK